MAHSDPEVAALGADGYLELLRVAPGVQVAGGLIYDAVIMKCAVAAGANVVLTFNERHLRLLAGNGLAVVVPA